MGGRSKQTQDTEGRWRWGRRSRGKEQGQRRGNERQDRGGDKDDGGDENDDGKGAQRTGTDRKRPNA